jgi:hypothetical protein
MSTRNLVLLAVVIGLAGAPLRWVGAVDESSPSASPSSNPASPTDLLLEKVNLDYDRAPNAVPAFEALGLTPETVTTPSTPRELVAELLNGVDRNGVLQHGIALETAPFRLLWVGTSLADYSGSPLMRCLYHFSISVATSKAAEESDAVQLALGFKDVLWESADHDPYRNPDLIEAFNNLVRGSFKPGFGQTPTISPDAKKAWKSAVDDFYENKWRGGIWTAAIAPTWNSESGKLGDLSGTGFTTWTTFAYGLPKSRSFRIGSNPMDVQFIAELRYRNGEQVTDPNDKTRAATQDSFLAAGRVRLGSDTFNGFAEGGYVRVWHGLNGDDDGWRGAVGLEKKIAKNVWLVLSAGQQFGGGTVEGNELFVLSSLRFGTADKAQFTQ